MDDVDAVQAQIARTMLQSGDWVTARLDGIRLPREIPSQILDDGGVVCSVRRARLGGAPASGAVGGGVVLADLPVWRVGLGRKIGFYAGLALNTSIGLFLFRIQIPDAALTLTITAALGSLLRALEDDELPGAMGVSHVGERRRRAASQRADRGLFPVAIGLLPCFLPGATGASCDLCPGSRCCC
jgi:4-amino-4-deoxy-L-arabinose transferase-like glycosyltransferase